MSARLKIKQLEQELQEVDAFDEPKVQLEQYQTRPHIAACILHTIQTSFGGLDNKIVADLGCGAGVLSVGARLLGARAVIGFDIDPEAIEVAKRNLEYFWPKKSEGEDDDENDGFCDLVISDVVKSFARDYIHWEKTKPSLAQDKSTGSRFRGFFDTVVMNPPFGTKHNKGLGLLMYFILSD